MIEIKCPHCKVINYFDNDKDLKSKIIEHEIHFFLHEEIGSHMARDIMKRLRYPHDIIDAVATAVENHMRTKQSGDEGDMSFRSLRKLKQDLGPHLYQVLNVIHADNLSHSEESNMPNQIPNIKRKIKELEERDKGTSIKPPLDGDDIMEILGIPKGPVVGKILKMLGDLYLSDPSLSKEELTEFVKKVYEDLK